MNKLMKCEKIDCIYTEQYLDHGGWCCSECPEHSYCNYAQRNEDLYQLKNTLPTNCPYCGKHIKMRREHCCKATSIDGVKAYITFEFTDDFLKHHDSDRFWAKKGNWNYLQFCKESPEFD